MDFQGTLGHEFVGTVDACSRDEWIGKRVVGEINAACGSCEACRNALQRHCPNRSVLGIADLDGCMADYCMLPAANLIEVPPEISDDRAVFCEPLSAACEILEQVPFSGSETVTVLGDGRLGILCAWTLSTAARRVVLVGHHPEKLAIAEWNGVETRLESDGLPTGADVVVEATGSTAGLSQAIAACRPRGTIVLKSTVADTGRLNLAPLVVDEITLIGSRCGRFSDGLRLMRTHPDLPLEKLISARFAPEDALKAFPKAAGPGVLKVLFNFADVS
jgi:alcohol dehydrogenase